MTPGMRAAASGINSGYTAQMVLTHNLSNAQSVGFKRRTPVFDSFGSHFKRAAEELSELPPVSPGTILHSRPLDMKSGVLQTTNRKHDYAIRDIPPSDKGIKSTENSAILGEPKRREDTYVFFVINTPNGERLTRNGHFHVNQDNLIVDQNGLPVQGLDGNLDLTEAIEKAKEQQNISAPIEDPASSEGGSETETETEAKEKELLKIDNKGVVWAKGQPLDQLKLIAVPISKISELASNGGDMFEFAGGQKPEKGSYEIAAGVLEGANVDPMSEMIGIMHNLRSVELNTNALSMMDRALEEALDEVAA